MAVAEESGCSKAPGEGEGEGALQEGGGAEESDDSTVSCLLSLNASTLQEAAWRVRNVGTRASNAGLGFAPAVDSVELARHPWHVVQTQWKRRERWTEKIMKRRERGEEEGRGEEEEEKELIYLSEGTRPNTPLIFTGVRDEGVDFAGAAGNWPIQPFDAVETGMSSITLSLSLSLSLSISFSASHISSHPSHEPKSATSLHTLKGSTSKTQTR